jgi:hypothetical protein
MPDYYRLLGIPRAATLREIKQAYHQRVGAQATPDAGRQQALAAAYDQWLRQQPDTRPPAMRARDEEREQLVGYARTARKVLLLVLAFGLLVALDWLLPLREYPREAIMERAVVSVGASMSDPQLGYNFRTPHTRFQLHSKQALLVHDANYLTVWRTPLLRVVRRVSAPEVAEGRGPIRPYDGGIYTIIFGWVPVLLLLSAVAGLLPDLRPELRLNLAVLGSLLALLTLGILLFC